ncbi:hypothetical protein AKJ57_02435 [candidate division MSBL1 archaeon SCGC-AAA259A05]|uniref:ABC3 transporter permease protein domain-containing protein n=1 Tax=candidate division MSBL1 archaeon SCGC-AAA259A05 TaxID=1698259 RepID=A0A133UA94_9EURY|nr:hypothetical protein AKJ57_02435 [candidate division MSBL1 archaeon SCGC-AAA259A05]
MRLVSFVIKNLGRRKVRTGLTVFGIAIAIAFSFVLLSVNSGSEEMMAGVEDLGPDIEAKEEGVQYFPTMSESRALALEEVEGVRKAVPTILWEYWSPEKRGFAIIIGISPSEASGVYGDTQVVKGRKLEGDDKFAIELGYRTAAINNVEIGDSLGLEGKQFEVIGILNETSSILDVMGVVPLSSLQSAMNAENKSSGIWLWVEKGGSVEEVRNAIEKEYPEMNTTEGLTVMEYTEEFTKFADAIRMIVIVVAVLIGALAAMNTVTMSTFERTREFGTLRALGASSGYIFKSVLVESVVLCVIGGTVGVLLGLGGALAAESIIVGEIGLDIVALPWSVPATAFGIALVVGLVAGIYPAWRVSRQEIVESLRYE